jgi:hypothetical protein
MAAERGALTAFQVEVARLFFSLPESDGYLLAGGAALAATDLTTRPTRDLDLFTHAPATSVAAACEAFVRAVESRGLEIVPVHTGDTFRRLVVRGGEEILVDLAVDAPPLASPVMTMLGPALAPLELAGRKLLALFGRAEARDFADVFVLVQRFGKDVLVVQAASADPGFSEDVLAQMLGTLDRFSDDEIPADPKLVPDIRGFFSAWAAELRS